MINKLNFTTDDGVTHVWLNQLVLNSLTYQSDSMTIYYATLEGILDAAKRYYLHKE